MKRYSLLDTRISKGFFFVYLTAMLFLSRDTLFSSSIVGFQKSQLLMFALIGVLGIWFLAKNRKNLKSILTDSKMIAFGISAMVLLVPMLVKQDWQLMYFSILLCMLFAVFLTYFTTSAHVAKYYVAIICLIGFYSVIATYGLRELAQTGRISPRVFYNSNGWDFFDFGFTYVVTWEYWHRNFGIFREPGVYQFFVLLALYLNNYSVRWDKAWTMWVCNGILVITMISTFAIGGFAELALFAVFLFLDKKYYREKWGRIAPLAIVLAALGIMGYVVYICLYKTFEHTIFYELYDMCVRLFTKSESSTDRLNAIWTNLELMAEHPLIGNPVAAVLHGTTHNTSSTLLLYAILGVLGGTVNVAAWIALAWKRERCVIGNLILLMILFMSFNTQNLVANVFFWLFPMMALAERGLPMIQSSVRKE